ncbi:MAG: hypothetical protein KDH96_10230, partial [Candidatus Riesia sp.]|nr:hypothetical protein [Candidatus Riesia sp.]
MFSDTVPDDIRTLLVDNLLSSFLGNREGALQSTKLRASEVIKAISKSNLNLSTKFKDALYSVIVKRGGKPSGLEYVYSTDGIYSAFYKLITNYSLEKEAAFNLKTLPELKSEAAKELARRNLTSLYPDILLPTYVELFGEEWRDHAPTLDDIGLVVETPNDDPASGPVVSENDIVSPAAWFYKKRTKSELKDRAKLCSQAINKAKGDLSVSIPFNTSEIEEIKRELQKLNEQDLNPDLGMSGVRSTTALDEIIETALERYRDTDPLGFKKDVEDILSSADRFNAKLQSDGANLKFYIHNNGSFGIHKTVNIPGLGAEIYRILAEKKQLYSPRLPVLEQDADSQYVSSTDKNIVFHRNLSENTEKLIRSSLNQIPDDFFSAERLFPAVKVFLVDRRGNDLFPGDILYSLDNIISIDITMDKNDAQLAVIKVADPLFSLQQDFFDKLTSNVRYDESNHPKYVLSNLRDEQSVTKRYRIAQGRAVQIRMGYGSMAYNLPITFTGKITEIIPGDQLTIIAQGWKAELMTRQVNFYNDDPKNWGARDLAVQAISYASPAGFGDYFSELDTRTILNGIDPQNVSDVISNSLYNGTNNDLENQGSRSYVSEGVNWLRRLIGLRSSDKK